MIFFILTVLVILIILISYYNIESFDSEVVTNELNSDVNPQYSTSYYRPNLVDNVPFSYLRGVDLPYPLTKPKIVVGYHYTVWSPSSSLMTPVWNAVKENIKSHFDNVIFLENNEGLVATSGVNYYPYIRKYVNGKAYTYKGPIDYEKLRAWILDPVHQYLIYGF